MRYFVTGGAGFIGSNYVRGLLGGAWGQQVQAVTVFDAFTYAGNMANLDPIASDPRLSVVTGDIRIATDIDSAIPGHDVVVHFAAESHVDRSIDGVPAVMAQTVSYRLNHLIAFIKCGEY